MARRRLLSDELWARHLEPPADEREIARHYTLGAEDLAQVAARRGDANRLGSALVLLYLRHPGRVLEVRIPPVAAVQCLPGPVHTRGTPPNVVETDPLTWIQLAAGRLDWAGAVRSGAVHASGPRADLAPYLPLVLID